VPIRNIVSVVVAILVGILSVVMVRNYLESTQQRPSVSTAASNSTSGSSVQVVVAAQPIARGSALDATMMKVANFPAGSVPANSYQNIAELTGENGKRLALRSFVADEAILSSEVSEPNGRLNLAGALHAGMRAVSVRSNEVAGVGGFVLPGDHVDVILTHQTGTGDKQHSITQVLAENALVLGVDQTANPETNTPVVAKAVTVEVSPDQAQTISLGQSIGTITLALRFVNDDAAADRLVTTEADLVHPAAKHAVRAHGDGGPQVHVMRGVTVSKYVLGQTTRPTSAPASASEGNVQP